MTTLFNFNLQKKTGVIYYSNKKIIRKFSTNTKNKTLINEYIGFNWYLEMYKSKIKNKIFKTEFIKKHNYINFPLIKAKKIYFWNTLKENEKYIKILINHYLKVWPKHSINCYHGDLTVENVLFENNLSPIIIDWEFFKKKEPWGLDVCHLLISAVILPTLAKKKKYIPLVELQLFKKYWTIFFKGKKLIYLKDPIKYLKTINKKISKSKKDDFIFKITRHQKKQLLEILKQDDK